MDTPEGVDNKWADYLKTKPDIVKVYLMNVNKNLTQDPKSLTEETLKHIVKLARSFNLRVVAHIETFEDLKIALHVGISLFAHMPHYNVNFYQLPAELQFTNKELRLIKKVHPVLIPTLSFNEEFSIVRNQKNNFQGEFDTASFKRSLDFQKKTVKNLKDAGFRFAIGSDRESLLAELSYWFKYQIFTGNEILTIATDNTPKLIFPDSKIGKIKQGFDGSFLVLDENPLLNWETIKHIRLKIKSGRVLK
jgi:imidazolonepropionase-like amidohydrolase